MSVLRTIHSNGIRPRSKNGGCASAFAARHRGVLCGFPGRWRSPGASSPLFVVEGTRELHLGARPAPPALWGVRCSFGRGCPRARGGVSRIIGKCYLCAMALYAAPSWSMGGSTGPVPQRFAVLESVGTFNETVIMKCRSTSGRFFNFPRDFSFSRRAISGNHWQRDARARGVVSEHGKATCASQVAGSVCVSFDKAPGSRA